jgi:3-hydroxyisobutyrate dehydrogenase-like beta-hydroxyacid dehydrogenase
MAAPPCEAPSTCTGTVRDDRDMTTVGLPGAGHMGAGLGWALREGGATVVTTLAGRSARTARFVDDAGLTVLDSLDAVVAASDVVLVVTPPAAALDAARAVTASASRTGARPLVADLNAISPSTVDSVAGILAGLDFVDGSISGPPPTVRPGARLYLSGERAAEVAALPWRHVRPVVVPGGVGRASALKMCTASVYKGTQALLMQAMRTAAAHGVLTEVLADLAEGGHPAPTPGVVSSVTKARRYVPEMREIATTQRNAGLPASLFESFAEVYAQVATTELGRYDPESVDLVMPPDQVMRLIRGQTAP